MFSTIYLSPVHTVSEDCFPSRWFPHNLGEEFLINKVQLGNHKVVDDVLSNGYLFQVLFLQTISPAIPPLLVEEVV